MEKSRPVTMYFSITVFKHFIMDLNINCYEYYFSMKNITNTIFLALLTWITWLYFIITGLPIRTCDIKHPFQKNTDLL